MRAAVKVSLVALVAVVCLVYSTTATSFDPRIVKVALKGTGKIVKGTGKIVRKVIGRKEDEKRPFSLKEDKPMSYKQILGIKKGRESLKVPGFKGLEIIFSRDAEQVMKERLKRKRSALKVLIYPKEEESPSKTSPEIIMSFPEILSASNRSMFVRGQAYVSEIELIKGHKGVATMKDAENAVKLILRLAKRMRYRHIRVAHDRLRIGGPKFNIRASLLTILLTGQSVLEYYGFEPVSSKSSKCPTAKDYNAAKLNWKQQMNDFNVEQLMDKWNDASKSDLWKETGTDFSKVKDFLRYGRWLYKGTRPIEIEDEIPLTKILSQRARRSARLNAHEEEKKEDSWESYDAKTSVSSGYDSEVQYDPEVIQDDSEVSGDDSGVWYGPEVIQDDSEVSGDDSEVQYDPEVIQDDSEVTWIGEHPDADKTGIQDDSEVTWTGVHPDADKTGVAISKGEKLKEGWTTGTWPSGYRWYKNKDGDFARPENAYRME